LNTSRTYLHSCQHGNVKSVSFTIIIYHFKMCKTAFRMMSLFSIERMLAVYKPMSTRRLFTKRKNICKIVSALLTTAILFYLYIVEANEIIREYNIYICTIKIELLDTHMLFVRIDTFISVIIPFIIISSINVLIVLKLRKSPSFLEVNNLVQGN